jgi:hypothetical protein
MSPEGMSAACKRQRLTGKRGKQNRAEGTEAEREEDEVRIKPRKPALRVAKACNPLARFGLFLLYKRSFINLPAIRPNAPWDKKQKQFP